MKYGQWCPIAKAAEVLAERWTLLVVRELVLGSTRYAQLQRGLGRISPGILSARLKTLTDSGIIERVEGEGAHEYRLTPAGLELAPILEAIGVWGQRWARARMTPDELDVEVLILAVQRNFDVDAFPLGAGVIAFVFTDLHGEPRRWWLRVDGRGVEVCTKTTGQPESVRITCTVRTLSEVYRGDVPLVAAIGAGRVHVEGAPKLVRTVHRWLRVPALAAIHDARCA